MCDKQQITEEPCEGKLSSTVLESSGSREGVTDFNIFFMSRKILRLPEKRYLDRLSEIDALLEIKRFIDRKIPPHLKPFLDSEKESNE
jgi:hypothetical protein